MVATPVTNPDPTAKLVTATPTVLPAPAPTTPVVVTPTPTPTGSQVVAVAGDTAPAVVDASTAGTTDTVVQPTTAVVNKPRQTVSLGRSGTLEVHDDPAPAAKKEEDAAPKKPTIMEMLEAPSAFNTWVKFYDQVKNCVKVLTGEEQLFL